MNETKPTLPGNDAKPATLPGQFEALPPGPLMYSVDEGLNSEQHKVLQEHFAKVLPGRTVVIIDAGARLSAKK